MNIKAFIQRHSVVTYFVIAFLISYGGFLVVVGPKLLRGEAMQSMDAFLLFPVIIVGVCLAGITLTGVVDGRSGLRDLFSRMGRWRVGVQWYAVALLTPPVLILAVLLTFRTLVSPVFTPHFFPIGILFGLAPGLFEEVGWMGYAFPRMHLQRNALSALAWGAMGAVARTSG